jgi:hypothetical protein
MSDPSSPPDDLSAVRTLVETLKPFDRADQLRIIRWAQEKLGLTGTILNPTPDAGAETGNRESPKIDIKTFVHQKKPIGNVQFSAVVAYYYEFDAPLEQRKHEIKATDLREAARLAGRERIADLNTTLRDAVKAGYLDRGRARGSYKINSVGENLVAMALPAGDKSDSGSIRKRATKRSGLRKGGKAQKKSSH